MKHIGFIEFCLLIEMLGEVEEDLGFQFVFNSLLSTLDQLSGFMDLDSTRSLHYSCSGNSDVAERQRELERGGREGGREEERGERERVERGRDRGR